MSKRVCNKTTILYTVYCTCKTGATYYTVPYFCMMCVDGTRKYMRRVRRVSAKAVATQVVSASGSFRRCSGCSPQMISPM